MTVIAFKDGKIAGDRLITHLGTRMGQSTKIAVGLGGILIGCSGHGGQSGELRDWFIGLGPRAREQKPPERPGIKDDVASLIVIYPDGYAEIVDVETGTRAELVGPFFALGSGSDYALGAMAAGASAVDAALIACRFNVHCGGGVDWLDRDGNGGRV